MTSFPIKFTTLKDKTGKRKTEMKSINLMTFLWPSQNQNHISWEVNCLLLIVVKATKDRFYLQMWYLQELCEVFSIFLNHLPQHRLLPCANSLFFIVLLRSYQCVGHRVPLFLWITLLRIPSGVHSTPCGSQASWELKALLILGKTCGSGPNSST